MQHQTWAPANLALIKYMGKMDRELNRPTNSSLSMTLTHLQTHVRITEAANTSADLWKPWNHEQAKAVDLSTAGQERFLKHFRYLKQHWGIDKNFLLESFNNFPSDCGLASSASAFAALTKASIELFQNTQPRADYDIDQLPEYSRRASGSSCRSFSGPFVLWYSEGVRPLEFPFGGLSHQVVVVSSEKKKVSSSEAHRRVVSSLLFRDRPARAEERLALLLEAFRQINWREAFEICWAEFMDMHALFETSQPSFGYVGSGSRQVLETLQNYWDEHGDGPLVTMDAGPNVHMLYRQDQKHHAEALKKMFSNQFPVIDSVDWSGEL